MKKLIYTVFIMLVMVSCKNEPKDYVTFSGKIENKSSTSLTIKNPKTGFQKVITVDENGAFSDTLKVETGIHTIFDGAKYNSIYLKNDSDIKMTFDTKKFDETLLFTGKGSNESNFLSQSMLSDKDFFKDRTILDLPKKDFDAKLNTFVSNFNDRINNQKLDPTFVTNQKENITKLKQYLNKKYSEKNYIATNLAKGAISPKFVDYENYKGGKTSLDDLKDKYVYIDLWATWCRPCTQEIPYLKKVEKQFHGKNIEFVSISVDRKKDYENWKKMVADKEMTGVQLYANRDEKFMNDYKVNSIPRFILLDPNGNIVDANAPRPSDPKLTQLLNSLKI